MVKVRGYVMPMGFSGWPGRFFALGCVVLLVAVLANNAELARESSPARSWAFPVMDDNATVFRLTFQVREGDRLTIDVRWSLRHLALTPDIAGFDVSLYEVPIRDSRPNLTALEPIRSFSGLVVDRPAAGYVFEPAPPVWRVDARSWLLYEIRVEHGDFQPRMVPSMETWAVLAMRGLAEDRGPGPEWGAFQVVRARALALQPAFYLVEVAALAALLAGAVRLLLQRRAPARGLEGGLGFADQARLWLRSVHFLLWLNLVGLVGLVIAALLLASGAELWLYPGLYPDAFYPWWMPFSLAVAVIGGGVGLVVMLVRVRRAVNAVPELDLDE